MTNNDVTMCAFLEVFQTNPEIFDQDLQGLYQTLTRLENQSSDTRENELKAWYQDKQRRDKIGIQIAKIAQRLNDQSSYREIKSVPPSNPSDDDTPIINRYRELREAVKERLNAKQQQSENKPSDDGKTSK
jgi:hypothetical protein